MIFPLRNTEKVRAAVYDAREELLEEDGTVKQGNKTKVSYMISHAISHAISHHTYFDILYDIAYDIA